MQRELIHVVRQWIDKAEDDWTAAEHMMKMGPEAPLEVICFHAQQCVEKYVKAFLSLHSTEFPMTHDIADLLALMPDPAAVALSPRDQERLTDYATVTRYSGDYDPITIEEAREAVLIARRARDSFRELVPADCLQR